VVELAAIVNSKVAQMAFTLCNLFSLILFGLISRIAGTHLLTFVMPMNLYPKFRLVLGNTMDFQTSMPARAAGSKV
jgi:hypothetical protein